MLIADAINRAGPTRKGALLALYGKTDVTQPEADDVRQLMAAASEPNMALHRVEEYTAEAFAALDRTFKPKGDGPRALTRRRSTATGERPSWTPL